MHRTDAADWVNVGIGAWLFASAFLWLHSDVQFANTWIVGVASAASALLAMRVANVRYVNALLALWLFTSAWALPLAAEATCWNNLLAGLLMFFVVLIPKESDTRARRSREPLQLDGR